MSAQVVGQAIIVLAGGMLGLFAFVVGLAIYEWWRDRR